GIEREARMRRPRPLRKQRDRFVRRQRVERGGLRRRQRQRIHGENPLFPETKRRAAGGQDLERRTGGQQAGGQLRRGRREVVAVVEQQQAMTRPELDRQIFLQRTAADGNDAGRGGDRRRDEGWIDERRQIDPDDAI